MELQAFEVQVCAKAETRGLEMAVFVKNPWAIASVLSQLFQGKQLGSEQVFDNPTFKYMDTLRKQIQSLVDSVWNHCSWAYAMLSKF